MNKSSRLKKEKDHSSAVNEEFSDGSASAFEGTEMPTETRENEDLIKENEPPASAKKNNTEKKDKETFY
jgi:hypothetical protein